MVLRRAGSAVVLGLAVVVSVLSLVVVLHRPDVARSTSSGGIVPADATPSPSPDAGSIPNDFGWQSTVPAPFASQFVTS